MSRHLPVAIFLLAVVFGFSAPQLCAQTVTGSLSGHVTDSSGALVPNVRITARHTDTGALRQTISGSEGYYLIPFLPLGTYEVTAELQGFATVVHKNIDVTLNKTTSLDISLTPSTVQETVTVSEAAPLIDTTSGQIRRTLDDSFIEVLPSAGRNFLGLAQQESRLPL